MVGAPRLSGSPKSHVVEGPLIQVMEVSKAYGGVRALDGVSLEIDKGEVHAVCGENGAGKSTLNKILSGSVTPDSGEVLVAGAAVSPGVEGAESAGIAIVHQESVAFPDLDAADNVFIGREFGKYWLDRFQMRDRTRSLLADLGESFPVDVPLDRLTLAQRQMIGIARALAGECRLLILDEPTGSLSSRETEALFRVVRRLREQRVSVLYVSHRLEEVFALADRVTVLRDGKHVATKPIGELNRDGLIQLMVGREVQSRPRSAATQTLGTGGLEFVGLNGVSLHVRRGEIVALAGLVGAGRSELARAAFGLDPVIEGHATLDGERLPAGNPGKAVAMGLAYLPEDRQHEGLHLPMSIRQNVSMASLDEVARATFVSTGREAARSASAVADLGIKTASDLAPAQSLSGGNQQKVLLAKWLATQPKALILDEPTRGVDVGAKAEVHRLIQELAAKGVAILLISSEMPEVLALADRVLVMRQGALSGEVGGAVATQDAILALALPREGDTDLAQTSIRRPVPRELGVGALLLLAAVAVSFVNPSFASLVNARDMLVKIAPAVIVSCGLTLVILAREIDISVGSLMGLCAAVLGIAGSTDRLGLPTSIAVALCLGVGVAGGLLNGLLVAIGRIPSIIVTLGMLTALKGVTEFALGGKWIERMPESLRVFGTGSGLGVPYSVWAALGVVLASLWITRRTAFGRRVYAIGSNPEAAKVAGLPVVRTQLALFAFTGFLAGLAALVSATQLQVIESGFGQGFELTAVAAVVVGGTSIRGGRGSIVGTVLGAALLGSLGTMLIFLKLGDSSVYWERAIGGAVILLAIVADYLGRRKEAAR